MQCVKMKFPDYIQALEEERRKIQVFPKELPLSLQLITQAIEACKQQLSGTTTETNLNGQQSECSEQTTSTDGPILEEFIPIKKRSSPYCEQQFDDQHSHKHQKILKNNNDKKKSDWLRSVQLWNPHPQSQEDVNRKVPVVELKRSGSSGGAFQPFLKEERVGKASESLSKETPSSSAAAVTSNNDGSSGREEKEGQRKQRRCWSPELHKRFLQSLHQLGGADSATPKQIRELMNVDGLTNDEVKSHLQKYRLHTRRPSSTVNDSANSQTTAPFVLVGNIFVQPQEYAAVAATSAASGENTKTVAPAGIYAPVATLSTHPSAVSHTEFASIKKPEFKKVELIEHSNSEERANHSEGDVHSNSHASSSSTHTITTTTTTTTSPRNYV